MILAERERERERERRRYNFSTIFSNIKARACARLAENKFCKPQNPVLFSQKKSSEYSSLISVLYESDSNDRIYLKSATTNYSLKKNAYGKSQYGETTAKRPENAGYRLPVGCVVDFKNMRSTCLKTNFNRINYYDE
jgi:hypothetical protein